MKLAALSMMALALPVSAQAAAREITPMAGYCVEALVEARALMTSAMITSTAKALGRDGADERVEFFTVPHEQLGMSRLKVSNLYACSVFPLEGAEGWTETSVAGHFDRLRMIEAPECAGADSKVWLSTAYNLRRNGVTAIADVKNGAVVEILAYETPDLLRPSDCKKEM